MHIPIFEKKMERPELSDCGIRHWTLLNCKIGEEGAGEEYKPPEGYLLGVFFFGRAN